MEFKVLKITNAESMPEILIYFSIESLGSLIHTLGRAVSHSGADPLSVGPDMTNAREDQQKLVDMIKSREGFAFADHAEYMRWYRWWSSWHKNELTNEQWNKLDRLLAWDGTQTEETFANWRPEGSWREAVTA